MAQLRPHDTIGLLSLKHPALSDRKNLFQRRTQMVVRLSALSVTINHIGLAGHGRELLHAYQRRTCPTGFGEPRRLHRDDRRDSPLCSGRNEHDQGREGGVNTGSKEGIFARPLSCHAGHETSGFYVKGAGRDTSGLAEEAWSALHIERLARNRDGYGDWWCPSVYVMGWFDPSISLYRIL